MTLHTGSQGHYHWLTSDIDDLADLMRNCPETILGKYLAVTAIDSAPLEVTEEDKVAGWETRKNIAYSPRIKSVAELPHENRHGRCEGFDEWYVFDRPIDLGQRFTGNIFEAGVEAGRVESFVNYYGFALHDATMQSITDLFWKQIEWMQPESYIADGGTCLTFVSCDQDLFSAVHKALMNSPVRG
jgi:hypothetical protein